MTAVLEAEEIGVRFGGLRALDGVNLQVEEGHLVGLIGPNGAGKTTFIDAITGFVPSSGRALLDGRDLSKVPAHTRARRGLVRTWQSIELFDDLSVEDNLAVSAYHPHFFSTLKEVFGRPFTPTGPIRETLAALGLEDIADASPRDLPQGQRKLVGVARALSAGPRVMLLDEPAAGLDSTESIDLGARLRRLVDSGMSMLLIDHDMGFVMKICDEIFVLDFGKVIASGTPEEVRANPKVVSAYLGSGTTIPADAPEPALGIEPEATNLAPEAK